MKYYTIFRDNNLLESTIDDLHSGEDWSQGGMLWTDKKLADKALENWKRYFTELKIVELKLK